MNNSINQCACSTTERINPPAKSEAEQLAQSVAYLRVTIAKLADAISPILLPARPAEKPCPVDQKATSPMMQHIRESRLIVDDCSDAVTDIIKRISM